MYYHPGHRYFAKPLPLNTLQAKAEEEEEERTTSQDLHEENCSTTEVNKTLIDEPPDPAVAGGSDICRTTSL